MANIERLLTDTTDPEGREPYPANEEQYPDARRIARKLSETQIRLLYELLELAETDRYKHLPLHPSDVPSATGLQQRGLIGTDRAMTGSILAERKRAVPGSRRWAWITAKGRAVAEHLPPRIKREQVEISVEHGRATIKLDGLTVGHGRLYGDLLVVTDLGRKLSDEQWDKVAEQIARLR